MATQKKTTAKKPVAKKKTSKDSRLSGGSGGFTAEEKAAMKARAAEVKAEAKAKNNRALGEKDLLAAIAALKGTDKTMATKVHKVVSAADPDLWPKTWYGMPAWAKNGKIICFFQAADKFKARYASFGFSDEANLDDGNMWPAAYALAKLTPAEEKKIAALVKKAVR